MVTMLSRDLHLLADAMDRELRARIALEPDATPADERYLAARAEADALILRALGDNDYSAVWRVVAQYGDLADQWARDRVDLAVLGGRGHV